MKVLGILAMGVLGWQALAADPVFEKVFKGKDTHGGVCELRVVRRSQDTQTPGWAGVQVEVSTNYAHHGHSHPNILLKGDAKDGRKLSGFAADGSSMTVVTDVAENFDTATAYGLRWKHGTHFHNERCTSLKP